MSVNVQSAKASWSSDTLETQFNYEITKVVTDPKTFSVKATPTVETYKFKTDLRVPKTGLLLVGLGGNNGSTTLGAILANKHNLEFETKDGVVKPNYYGSVTQASTIKIGVDENGNDVYVPFKSLVPLVDPNNLVVGGWDISKTNLKDSMKRSKVLDIALQSKLGPYLKKVVPLPSIYYPDFIAKNQVERADNVVNVDEKTGKVSVERKWEDVQIIRKNINDFKRANKLDKVIVLWTANTERYCEIIPGVHDTSKNLLEAIKSNHSEISPSTVFATACILEKIPYINGSPQNTFVPGVIQLAEEYQTFIGGDDFKTGQTKVKSVIAQYLVDAGIKPLSIASYNHLGNNDGYNLSSPKQFRSKEISKQSVVDDIIASNKILYPPPKDHVDHCIVIKYIPAVGDSKVAMDEYYSELMLGGHNRLVIHNTCEDSLLAVPIILDLVVVTELLTRIQYKKIDGKDYKEFYSILSFLSYWLKAPLTRDGFDPINGLNKQRNAIENLLKLLVGLPINNDLRFEERLL